MEGNLKLWRNDRKKQDKHPDYTGTGKINGEDVDVAGWLRVPDGGGKQYLSVKIGPKRERQQTPPQPPPAADSPPAF